MRLIPASRIIIGSRQSPLAQAQVREVEREIKSFYANLDFECLFVETQGDIDQTTSLRTLQKTDFFTKEVDALLLSKACRIAIHSAKDLPDQITDGIKIIALTKGVDQSDSLVFRPGETLESLKIGAVIATSSERREGAVKKLRSDFKFIDLRGPIHQRLLKLEKGEADGVVVAEAALIRLELTHLSRLSLPGETTPFQGQLAIASRHDDHEMEKLFRCLDTRCYSA